MNKQKYLPDSGFSLLEVLVAILIVTFFTTVAMQMMVISAAFKAKAKDYTTATNLIEQDLEKVRNLAGEYEFPTIASPTPTVGATVLTLSNVNGLKNNDKIQFSSLSDTTFSANAYPPNIYTIQSTPDPNSTSTPTITITPGIILTAPMPTMGARVVSNTVCSATSATTGLANDLQQVTQNSSYIDGSKTMTISEGSSNVTYEAVVGANPHVIRDTNKKLWLMRNDTNLNAAPYNVLQVRYLVVKPKTNGDPDPNKIVAQLSSEVIPNASFQCIQ